MWKKIILTGILAGLVWSSAGAQSPPMLGWSDAPNLPINRHLGDWMLSAGWFHSEEIYPKVYQVGATLEFPPAIPEFDDRRYTYELKYISDHAYFWFTPETDPKEVAEAAHFFETIIRPLNHDLYGEALANIDGDSHVHLVHAQYVGFGAVGLFRYDDQCPRWACPTSAERDILYYGLSWGGVNSPEHLSTLTHEYQHIIRYAQDGNEKRWLNEGFSLLAEYLAGFDLEYVLGENLNVFLSQPSIPLDGWAEFNGDPAGYYAASFLFLKYLYERFGYDYIQSLSKSPYDGLAAVYHTLPADLDRVFVDWALANATNAYTDLEQEIRGAPQGIFFDESNHAVLEGDLPAYSASYWTLPAGDYRLSFEGAEQIHLGEPYSGDFVWWSYPQEFSSTRLTRPLDLRKLDTATLNYQVWYELEQNYDWGNVMVSLDGGKTWKALQTHSMQSASASIPVPHYTGRSEGWQAEQIDLSSFVGYEIQIRFETVTDGSYSEAGMRLDNLQIPELGWFDDTETLDETWRAEGFIRVPLLAPQTWALRLITREGIRPPETHFQLAEEGILMVAGMSPLHSESASYKLTLERR